ncbi:MAG: serine/threonine-protein phosphatase [Chromatiales bacterium]|nr:serine/threonine-protein phosphatase [Chromatiales bacterium]
MSDVQMQCLEVRGGNRTENTKIEIPGLTGWIYSRPYHGEAAGGDVHFVSSCATGRITRWLVADVCGHGDAVAEVSDELHDLMRRYVNFIDQSRLVKEMNTEFADLAQRGDFATAVVFTYFAPTGELCISNAGHPRPFLYRAEQRSWARLVQRGDNSTTLSNIPLGVVPQVLYDREEFVLDKGDIIISYTDSLIEVDDRHGQQLREAGLLRLISELSWDDPMSLGEALLARLESDYDLAEEHDDVTLLIMQSSGPGEPISLRNRLLAPWRLLEDGIRSRLNGDRTHPEMEWSVRNLGGALYHPWNFRKPRGGSVSDEA